MIVIRNIRVIGDERTKMNKVQEDMLKKEIEKFFRDMNFRADMQVQ